MSTSTSGFKYKSDVDESLNYYLRGTMVGCLSKRVLTIRNSTSIWLSSLWDVLYRTDGRISGRWTIKYAGESYIAYFVLFPGLFFRSISFACSILSTMPPPLAALSMLKDQ